MSSDPDPALRDAIARLGRASVTVVGDVMLDRFVFGSVARISPEAPVPVLSVDRELAVPGGAGNAVRNLTALGAAAALISVVGDDQAGSDLTGLIGGQPNVEPWLLVQGGRCTTVKTRFIGRGQQLLRADHENVSPIHPKLAERMLRIAADALAATSVTLLIDYGKGVLDGTVAERLIANSRAAGRPTIVLPKGLIYERYAGADVILPTLADLETVTGLAVNTASRIAAAAAWLRRTHGFGAVLVQRGAEGLTLADEAGVLHLAPVGELADPAGTADTLAASLGAALASGSDVRLAARLATLAVSVASGQAGMAVARAADLAGMLTPQGRVRRKIVSAEQAMEQIDRWRRMGFRTGLLLGPAESARLARARTACDRLVVATGSGEGEAEALASSPLVDLVCALPGETAPDMVALLRPDLVIDASPPPDAAELVRSWGGELVVG